MITSKNLGRLTLGLLAFMTFKTTLGSEGLQSRFCSLGSSEKGTSSSRGEH